MAEFLGPMANTKTYTASYKDADAVISAVPCVLVAWA